MKPSEILPVLAPVGTHHGALVLMTEVAEGLGVGFINRAAPERLVGPELLRRLDMTGEHLLMLALANLGNALATIESELLERDVVRLSMDRNAALPAGVLATMALRADFYRQINAKEVNGWSRVLLGMPRRDVLLLSTSEQRLRPWIDRFYAANLPGRLLRDVLGVDAKRTRVSLTTIVQPRNIRSRMSMN